MIRRAAYDDIPALRAAFGRMLKETDAGGPGYPVHDARALDTFTVVCAERLERDPTLLAYVATNDATGALEGFLAGTISDRLIGAPTRFAAAHWLYVEPAARGRGIARALVRLAIPDVIASGVTVVELAARAGDTQWERRGWYPFLTHYVLPVEAVLAAAAERPELAPAPVAEEPAPAPLEELASAPPTNGATNGAAHAPPAPRRRARPPRRHRRRRPEAACPS